MAVLWNRQRVGLTAMAGAQSLLNFRIAHLPEIGVPLTDGVEPFGRGQTNTLVRFFSQSATGFRRSDRDGDDQPLRVKAADMPGRSHHGGARRQAIVNQHYGTAMKIGRRAAAPVKLFATFQLTGFASHNRLNVFFGNPELVDQMLVQHGSSARYRTHRELGLPGNAYFADHHYVEGRLQSFCDRSSNWNAAPRQRQDNRIGRELARGEFGS